MLQSTSGASQSNELIPTLPLVITPASGPSSVEAGDPPTTSLPHIYPPTRKAPDQVVSRAFTVIHKQLKDVENTINVNTKLEPGR